MRGNSDILFSNIDILFCQITTFIKVRLAYFLGSRIDRFLVKSEVWSPKKGHTNLYESCDVKVKQRYNHYLTWTNCVKWQQWYGWSLKDFPWHQSILQDERYLCNVEDHQFGIRFLKWVPCPLIWLQSFPWFVLNLWFFLKWKR